MDEKKVREAIKALKITIDIGKQKIEYNKTFEPKNDNEPIEKSVEHAKTAIKHWKSSCRKKLRLLILSVVKNLEMLNFVVRIATVIIYVT